MNLGKVWEIVEDKRAWGAALHGVAQQIWLWIQLYHSLAQGHCESGCFWARVSSAATCPEGQAGVARPPELWPAESLMWRRPKPHTSEEMVPEQWLPILSWAGGKSLPGTDRPPLSSLPPLIAEEGQKGRAVSPGKVCCPWELEEMVTVHSIL